MRKFEITEEQINTIISIIAKAPTEIGFHPVLILRTILQGPEIKNVADFEKEVK